MKIWVRTCSVCKEDTFGKEDWQIDTRCSLCGEPLKDKPRTQEVADIVSEKVEGE